MEETIKKIQKSIRILNHNSTEMNASLKSLCKSITEVKDAFQDHKEEYIETRTDVKSIKRMVWWMLSVVVVGTLLGIFSAIVIGGFFLFLG